MSTASEPTPAEEGTDVADVIVVGAGVSGLYQAHRGIQMGLSVSGIEAGSGVGGTWYWNRYPGARFDSESYVYGYSFSDELMKEWEWSEHFASQEETLRYLEHVADKFDLRRHYRFDTRVVACRWDDEANVWNVEADSGDVMRARFVVTAMGALSIPTTPDIEGIDDFKGLSFHTSRWPHEPVEVEGKRIGVIGTGATGVQLISELAKVAGRLTVFQRSPNWCAPLNNGAIDDGFQARLKTQLPNMMAQCLESFGGFIHDPIGQKAADATPEERQAFWEHLYGERGFGIAFGNYRDVLLDPVANGWMTDFIASKIRQRVHDPEVADKLIPKDHGFATKRVPLETHYYEVYNQDNVELVDVKASPIERVTGSGIETADESYALDVLIYATGFDGITGAFREIDFEGVEGVTLAEAWEDGPRTILGIATPGFPNMFMVVGPHSASTLCNMPRCIEQNVDWISECIAWVLDAGFERIEATPEAAREWTDHVYATVDRFLFSKVDSWFNGYNTNLPAKVPTTLMYGGGLPMFRERCDEIAMSEYAGFVTR